MLVMVHTYVDVRNGSYGVTSHRKFLTGSFVTVTAVLCFLPRSCVPGQQWTLTTE